MQKSRSLRSFRIEEDDRRYSSRSRRDKYGDSEESNLVRTPPSRGRESGNAGATEARKYPDENYVRSSAQPSTKDGRGLSRTSAKYRDEFKRRRSSDPYQDFSVVRGRNYWSKPEVPDRRSSLHSTRLDEDARPGARPRESNAGARANTYRPNEVRATQDTPPRRRSWMPHDRFPSKESTISPSGGDKKSRMLGDYGSKLAKRDDDAIRSSRRDLSPPRKTSSMPPRVRGDMEPRIDVRDGRWSPDAPPDYASPPRGISSKTRQGHDDYESRSYRRRSEHSPTPSRKASRTSRAYSNIEPSSSRWSGARRTDSPTGGSSPHRRSASKSSILHDGNEQRAYYPRSEDDSPNSPHGRPIHPPRTYSQTSRVRGDIEPSSDGRSGTGKMYSSLHSPSPLWSAHSEAYSMPGASTRKHSRRQDGGSLDRSLNRRISPRRSGRADEDSRADSWSDHRLDSARKRSSFLQRTPETYRVPGGVETATAQKRGGRRTERPVELGSPPQWNAFKTTAAIDNYKSGPNLRQRPDSSSEPAPTRNTSKEIKTRGYTESSAIRQGDVRKTSSPLDRLNISKMVSSTVTSGHKSEPKREGRSGSFRPGSQSDHTDPPKRQPPSSKASAAQVDTDPNAVRRTRDTKKSTATEGTTLSTRKGSASRGDARKDVPLDFKPMPNVDKSSGEIGVGAGGHRPPDSATTRNAAEPNKTAKDAPADVDAEHRKYSYVPLEETEEAPIPKAPETPPSEEYVPPSQVGHAVQEVDESLGPLSDDDDDDQYQEVDVDDSRFGWFRLWVLCSVAALVLLLPFALTIMSYDAVAWIQKSGASDSRGQDGLPEALEKVRFYDDETGRPRECDLPNYTGVGDLVLDYLYPQIQFTTPAPYLTFRRLFCVYDIMRVTGGLLRNLSYFPLLHCTDIIVYSLHYISTTADVEPKRRIFVGGVQVLPFSSAIYHSYRKVNVYATLGGSRADSPALAMASSNAAAVAAKLRDIVSTNKYTGVNFDWDRPNDECDSKRNGLLSLLKEFSDVGDRVLVTIAPDADIVKKHYPLLTVPLPQVEYVIVATHRLRAEGVVSCSGGQIEAALAYWAIRKLLEPVFTEKVIYSTALGGDVYFSKTTQLLSYGTPLSPLHGLTQGIPKISYTDICKLAPVNVTDDCSLYLLERNSSGYKVVPFVGVREMWNRQTTAEGFQMSRIPIVVYDIHLDDYGLACDGYPWPLTRTLSEPVSPKLRPFG